MAENIVYLKCDRCKHVDLQNSFSYIGEDSFSCPKCNCNYTHVFMIIDPDKPQNIKIYN